MNIFYLDSDPKIAAYQHCLKHKVKMILESAQMLACAYYVSNGITSSKQSKLPENKEKTQIIFKNFPRHRPNGELFPYGIGYVNHPCTVWSYSSIENWYWLLELAYNLGFEYSRIYKKEHACMPILDWFSENPPNLPNIELYESASEQLEYKTKDNVKISGIEFRSIANAETGKDKLKDLGNQTRNGLSVRSIMTCLVFIKALSYFR
jgi:hypothetical protein